MMASEVNLLHQAAGGSSQEYFPNPFQTSGANAKESFFKRLLGFFAALAGVALAVTIVAYTLGSFVLSFLAFLTLVLAVTLLVTAYVDFLTSDAKGRMGLIFSKRGSPLHRRRAPSRQIQLPGTILGTGRGAGPSLDPIIQPETTQGSSQSIFGLIPRPRNQSQD